MIAVLETEPGVFETVTGNPTLTSLDGKVRAPLAVVLADSWTAAERAKFGVYLVEPFVFRDGKRAVSAPRYERQAGKVVQLVDVEDAPARAAEPPLSLEAKLSVIGVTLDELREALKG